MRERLGILFEDVDIDILHGLNAAGSKLCFYTWAKETGRTLSTQSRLIQNIPSTQLRGAVGALMR